MFRNFFTANKAPENCLRPLVELEDLLLKFEFQLSKAEFTAQTNM